MWVYCEDMFPTNEKTLDRIFYALSDSSRRQMLRDLASRDCQVRDLANSFSFSKAATSKHLAVLEEAGLIKKFRKGRDVLCSINPSTLQTVEEWIYFYRRFWDSRLDALEEFISIREMEKRE